jgi:uncharacterized protein with HEPN domain
MPSEPSKATVYLLHIRDNITLVRSFVDGFDYERFRDTCLSFTASRAPLRLFPKHRGDFPPQ